MRSAILAILLCSCAASPATTQIERADLYPANNAPRELLRYIKLEDISNGVIVDVVMTPLAADVKPAILLNGKALTPTTVINEQHLLAVVPRSEILDTNRVQVTWPGARTNEVVATRHSD